MLCGDNNDLDPSEAQRRTLESDDNSIWNDEERLLYCDFYVESPTCVMNLQSLNRDRIHVWLLVFTWCCCVHADTQLVFVCWFKSSRTWRLEVKTFFLYHWKERPQMERNMLPLYGSFIGLHEAHWFGACCCVWMQSLSLLNDSLLS